VIQRGTARPAPAAVTRAEREARYAGFSEPLRSRLIALLEEKERQRDQAPQMCEDSANDLRSMSALRLKNWVKPSRLVAQCRRVSTRSPASAEVRQLHATAEDVVWSALQANRRSLP
jgi:hypothetical protein